MRTDPLQPRGVRRPLRHPRTQDDIGRAWWFFVRCRQARGGIGMSAITKNAWAASTRTRRQMPEPVSKYLAALDGLDAVAARTISR